MRKSLTLDQLDQLPRTPGVYYFLNVRKEIVYVGKATSLRTRVGSYWANPVPVARSGQRPEPSVVRGTGQEPENRQITQFLAEVTSIRVRETPSALEALILEGNEIKRLQPRYNVLQKDDKRFASIVITRESFPQLLVVRPTDKRKLPIAKSFGPYRSAFTARLALKILRRIFPFRCNQPVIDSWQQTSTSHSNPEGSKVFNPPGWNKVNRVKLRSCLYYPMGLCPGTCIGAIDKDAYQLSINWISEFLSGRRTNVIRSLRKLMTTAAKERRYEAAAKLRDQLFALDHIHDVALLTDDHESSIAQFPIQRIECYDISLSAGRNAVGSMVVLHYGTPAPAEYRLFKIKTVQGTNDVAMLVEVLNRRLKHTEWPLPDLWTVDGGLPQRNAASTVLRAAGLKRPAVIGITKGPARKRADRVSSPAATELIRHHGIKPNELEHVLRRARDEAHRFAITFHRKRRSKHFLTV